MYGADNTSTVLEHLHYKIVIRKIAGSEPAVRAGPGSPGRPRVLCQFRSRDSNTMLPTLLPCATHDPGFDSSFKLQALHYDCRVPRLALPHLTVIYHTRSWVLTSKRKWDPMSPIPLTSTSYSTLEALYKTKVRILTANIVPLMTPVSTATAQNASEKKMWTEYMKETEKYDSSAAEAWKEDSEGILVFVRPSLLLFQPFISLTNRKTGLFSATVGAFIIEFYKKLSPDSGDQTVALLCQISQQFPNFTNGTCSPPQPNQSFSPGASIIWVNALWIISLLFSLSSALFATLLQQWARRYVQMPQIPNEPKRRACIRSFLFFGTRKYKMRLAVETAPALLHLSVFLFFAGLVILFFSIHKAVAIIVSISVGIFVVAYVVLTALPYLRHNCPYRTPMSNVWWYISHPTILSISFCFHRLFRQLHSCVVPYNFGEQDHLRQRIILPVMRACERAVEKHAQRLKEGFWKTIMRGALQASDSLEVEALTWWLQLPTMAEETKAQDFLACIPKQTVVQLMRDTTQKSVFLEYLLTLLRTCGPGSLSAGLDEDERNTRLLVCLHTIHRITQDCIHRITNNDVNQNIDIDVENANINVDHANADVDFVRSNFANIGFMQEMWDDSDTGIRVTSRSICALLARCILLRRLPGASELGWLHGVIGESANAIFNADHPTRDRMNLKAFVYGILANQADDLRAECATSFTETLAILLDAGIQSPFDGTEFQEQLSDFIQEIEKDATAGSTGIVEKLRRMFVFEDSDG
jgi:hypothetical protein